MHYVRMGNLLHRSGNHELIGQATCNIEEIIVNKYLAEILH